jgi:hypothetical protein
LDFSIYAAVKTLWITRVGVRPDTVGYILGIDQEVVLFDFGENWVLTTTET